MPEIIYDVAVSADGFIAGPRADISKFPHRSPVAEDYFARLKTYACALMGRATYEFGYAHGLKVGDNPYPHMHCVVFSSLLALPDDSPVEIVRDNAADRIAALKDSADGPLYLCGGGAFAGWMLSQGLIDTLRLKRAPILLGSGTRLFGAHTGGVETKLTESKLYEDGTVFQAFEVMKP